MHLQGMLFSSPLPSPGAAGNRESTLKAMQSQFEAKLANERDLQTSLLKRLENAAEGSKEVRSFFFIS